MDVPADVLVFEVDIDELVEEDEAVERVVAVDTGWQVSDVVVCELDVEGVGVDVEGICVDVEGVGVDVEGVCVDVEYREVNVDFITLDNPHSFNPSQNMAAIYRICKRQ